VAPNAGALAPARELLGVEQRVEFVLSGSRRLEARADLPLSRELVYYLYIGRRLPAKGYDVLLDAFDVAYAADNSLRLILVGDGTIERHPGVIDVGRSEDPSIWLACCDYLVSPNRHSYFDLAIMEAMSIGTPVLMTATEGHEYFASIQHDGLVTTSASDPAELAAALLGNRRKRKQNATGTRANMEIYEATFSVTKYQSRLTDFFHRLL
jgi:glycosyltransferase involved in cell wall biosynthesis